MNNSIKNKIKELNASTSSEVGVGFGKKIVNGKYSGEVGFTFAVKKKKPLNQLPQEEIFPSFIDVEGIRYKTDVIEIKNMRPLVSCNPVAGDCLNCDPTTPTPCYSTWMYPTGYDPEDPLRDSTIIIPNQGYHSYLKGGIQITSHTVVNLYHAVGTLGFMALDAVTGGLVGVTNNHVMIGNAFYTNYRSVNNVENELSNRAYMYDSYYGNFYTIGQVMRYVPILADAINNTNRVDASIFAVRSSYISLTESYKQYGLSYTLPMSFASTAEIDGMVNPISPYYDPPIYSSGRTTGPKEGNPCGLTITNISFSSDVELVNFSDCILFTRTDPQCPWPIAPGDSGSALIANFNGTWKIIGLCFAGNEFWGLACRIDNVASELGIEAWDGTSPSYIDTGSQLYITTPGQSGIKTVVCDGKTYWQIGATNISQPCT